MGFEEFGVVLLPTPMSSLRSGNGIETFSEVVDAIVEKWPDLRPDEVEIARLVQPPVIGMVLLVSETDKGLIQFAAQLGHTKSDDIALWMRFAYCNPRTIYQPFCLITEWLMNKYELYCHIEPSQPPELKGVRDVFNSRQIRSILIPCMDYNRELWQLDAGTHEEMILRPADALAYFIEPQFTHQK